MAAEFRPYPLVSLHIDKWGMLNMWQGELTETSKRDADVLIQDSQDISATIEALPEEQRKWLDDGWTIETYCISDEYFA